MIASVLLIDRIRAFFPHNYIVAFEGSSGNPFPIIVASYPPLFYPELGLEELIIKFCVIGVTPSSIGTIP